MLKKIWILFFICVISLQGDLRSQSEGNIWYFGNGLGLDFSSTTPSLLTNGAISTSVGCSAICSSSGTLLFYTDGVTVWNQNHAVMGNGTGLFGNPGAQNCVIVKKPLSSTLYYIFTVQGSGGSAGLCFSIVDMSLASGTGSVTVKNSTLLSVPCEEKITATSHCNQIDSWVMVHEMNSPNYQSFLLTSTGVTAMVTSSCVVPAPFTGTTYAHTGFSPRGSMKFSPNGRKIASIWSVSNPTVPMQNGGVTYCILEHGDFDNSTGAITTFSAITAANTSILSNGWVYGTEFSPDGTKLYYTYWAGLMQVDYCNFPSTVNGAIVPIGEGIPPTTFLGSLQLGRDGKIYVARPGGTTIGVINNPNNPGSQCNYQPGAISVGSNTTLLGLPNFHTKYFEKTSQTFTAFPVAGPNCNTFSFFSPTTCVTFQNATFPFSGYIINSYLWSFGDTLSASSNTSTLPTPTHSFTSPGTYTVKLSVTYLCGRTDVITKTLTVPPSATLAVLSPSLSCGNPASTVNVSGASGSLTYTWYPSLVTGSIATNLVTGTHTVVVKDDSNGCIYNSIFNNEVTIVSSSVNTSPICATASSGTAAVIVLAGSGSYTYSWSGSSNTSSFSSSLLPGTYTVSVFDVIGNCQVSNTFQLVQKPPIILTVFPSANLPSHCIGNPIVLAVNPSGGSPAFTYSWSSGSTTNTILVNPTLQGTYIYTVNVNDQLNCSSSQTYAAIYFQTPTITTSNATVCSGSSTTLSANGANSYSWLPGSFQGALFPITPTISSNYTVVGINGLCTSTSTLAVTVLVSPSVNIISSYPVCAGQSLTMTASGASTYFWSGPLGFNNNKNVSVINNLSASHSGVYVINGMGNNSCQTTTNISITVNALPTITINTPGAICVGADATITVGGGSTYQWSNGFTTPIIKVSPLINSVYNVTVMNVSGCSAISAISVQVFACTGVEEFTSDDFAICYPNPAQTVLNLRISEKMSGELVDEKGAQLGHYDLGAGDHIIDVKHFAEGIYYLNLSTETNKKRSFKVVKVDTR